MIFHLNSTNNAYTNINNKSNNNNNDDNNNTKNVYNGKGCGIEEKICCAYNSETFSFLFFFFFWLSLQKTNKNYSKDK